MSIRTKPASAAYKNNYDGIDWGGTSEHATVLVDEAGRYVAKYGHEPALERTRGIESIRTDRPHCSEAGAIHVDQVADFNKNCVSGVHYEPGTGRLVSESKHAREREARRRGLSFN